MRLENEKASRSLSKEKSQNKEKVKQKEQEKQEAVIKEKMTAEELLRETIREKHEFHETEMEHLREEHRAVVRHLKRDHKNAAVVAAAEHEQLRIELESCLEGAAWLVEGLKEQQTEAKAASEFWAADATGLHEQELRALRAEMGDAQAAADAQIAELRAEIER